MNHTDDLPGRYQLHLQRHSACGEPACRALGPLSKSPPACLPACPLALAVPGTRTLVSRWDGHLVQLQLQPQGMGLVQCLRTQLEKPRSDWEASWPSRVGAGRGGAEGWRKCLLSQVTRGADAATPGGPWAPGQRVGGRSPSSSMTGPLLMPSHRCQLESTVTTPQIRMYILP